ncbi:DUF4367 domain-containing protein [Paenibacillus silvae]|uniref:DUF4367 domain-containing protein n=1 Tax=Paenibacillus silvae TaxID=1325358 RepID=UPI00119DE624|nr:MULTISPECIES: DUF4367 domain-containing protein [Paenibacillus]MCK6077934.1 DUF4367 domain-containing protein [Paenibacillus silvae]MCK6152133.1 DUF4367 domain-containing protein [Paenibacillus silvae]MCK6270818.1 DUF4367 domain-containing protein [Paenibacillus silvae]
MKHNDPEHELKRLFQKVEPSGTDLQDRIMSLIRKESAPKERFIVKHRVGVLLIAGLLLTASTGFAAMNYQSLFNDKGDVLLEEKPLTADPVQQLSQEEQQRMERMNEIWMNEIKPGEAALIYIVPNNPQHQFDIRSNPLRVENFEQLSHMVHVPGIPLSQKLSGASRTYTFQKASVSMEYKQDVYELSDEKKEALVQELRLQAQTSGQDHALMPVPVTDQFWLSSMTYVSGQNEISLSIMNNKDNEPLIASYDENLNTTSRKININGQDVIARTYGGDFTELMWVYQEPKTKYAYHYTLGVREGVVPLEELNHIAETLIPASDR